MVDQKLTGISLSLQTFEDLIQRRARYVDKTALLLDLIQQTSKAFFLSRPRRFGKSLTITTLESIFLGKRGLFEGLAISESDYDWPVHPVIRLDMKYAAEANFEQAEIGLGSTLNQVAQSYDISLSEETIGKRFEELIQKLYQKTHQKVVVLIDEYDKPLIDNLDNIEVAKEIQGLLKRFYGVLKSADEYLRFVLITGVSKFTRVSVFSDLNHLTDLTMDTRYATLVGMTEEEIVSHYDDYIQAIADDKGWTFETVMEEIRRWYNGYRFSRQAIKVYNPWSTLSLLNTKEFIPHWHVTGVPKMLVDIINRDAEGFSDLNPADFEGIENQSVTQFDAYEIEYLEKKLIAVLTQTGFLTIKEYDEDRGQYTLGYPNWEVKSAFTNMVLDARLKTAIERSQRVIALDIRDGIRQGDIEAVIAHLNYLIASIPGNLHTSKESYYHSLIHMAFQISGLTIRSEEWVSGGRIDTVIEQPDQFYIIEFKFNQPAQVAIEQIKTRKYSAKFPKETKPITAVGISVDCATKTIVEWVEKKL